MFVVVRADNPPQRYADFGIVQNTCSANNRRAFSVVATLGAPRPVDAQVVVETARAEE